MDGEAPAPGGPADIAESLGRYNDELLYLLLEKPEVRAALTREDYLESTGPQGDADLVMALRRTASPSFLQHAGLA